MTETLRWTNKPEKSRVKICCDENICCGWLVSKVHPPQLSGTFLVKASFSLRHGATATWAEKPAPLSGDLYVDDDPRKALRYSSDFAPFKPRADVLLLGTACAPKGSLVPSLSVSMRVGDFAK